MPDDDCLNLRLGDYFHQRREPVERPPEALAPPPPRAPEPRG